VLDGDINFNLMEVFMAIINCNRCALTVNYKGDYLFNDGKFFGDNGDRAMFKEDEIICVNCISQKED